MPRLKKGRPRIALMPEYRVRVPKRGNVGSLTCCSHSGDFGITTLTRLKSSHEKGVTRRDMGRGYADLEIKDGGQASTEFLRADLDAVRRRSARRCEHSLERARGLDTEGMV